MRRRRLRSVPAALVGLAACVPPAFEPPAHDPVPPPPPAEVAAALFLVGDAGDAAREESPLAHRLRADVERWSARLADSAAAVVFLGDNVYPVGVRDRDHPAFPTDSARLQAQVWAVSGPTAVAAGTAGIFLAGNHDWGNMRGARGVARLRNQEGFLDRASAATGARVALAPAAGQAGPVVVDLAGSARLIVLDTHWWLQAGSAAVRDSMLVGLRTALAGASGRPVVVAAHHPYVSAGPHAGFGPVDPYVLLRKAGAVVQDLNAPPFRSLREGLARTFAEAGRPLVYAAGHDHSLQVHRGTSAQAPEWSLVSGSGSKLSRVSATEGLEWAGSRPGYMALLIRRDGGVLLEVTAAPVEALVCDDDDARVRTRCVDDGVAAFEVVYRAELRPGGR